MPTALSENIPHFDDTFLTFVFFSSASISFLLENCIKKDLYSIERTLFGFEKKKNTPLFIKETEIQTTEAVTTRPPIQTTTEEITTRPPIETTTEEITTRPPIETTEEVTTRPPIQTTEEVTTKPPIPTTEKEQRLTQQSR